LYEKEIKRARKIVKSQGGLLGSLMNASAGMTEGMQGMANRQSKAMILHPPLVNILRCTGCGAALSVLLPSNSSD
jgi:hypothetical protein